LIEANALPLSQTANLRHNSYCLRNYT